MEPKVGKGAVVTEAFPPLRYRNKRKKYCAKQSHYTITEKKKTVGETVVP
jgi:hypothetical protein